MEIAMKIRKVLASRGLTGFYFDDQLAIRKGAKLNGHFYVGKPLTRGHTAIRMPGESESIILILEDGQIAYGDCCSSQYSGAGGRDSPLLAGEAIPLIERELVPRFEGQEVTTFRQMAEEVQNLLVDGAKLHSGVRYGMTQALLDAVAKKNRLTMAEVLAMEYRTRLSDKIVPIFVQTGDDRYIGADKAIVKRAQVLPHGLINNVEEKVGKRGEILLRYVHWLRKRIIKLGGPDYVPTIHLDVYGTIGLMCRNDLERVQRYIVKLEAAASPYRLQIELPIDMGEKKAQMEAMGELRKCLEAVGSKVKLVADEWSCTLAAIKEWADSGAADIVQVKTTDVGGIDQVVEALLYCRSKGAGAYLGGTCNETDKSARVCTHVALATSPDQMLAKPGMAVDEGLMTVFNEMQRTLAILRSRA
jgi:methylaspartate ammonia-lyase